MIHLNYSLTKKDFKKYYIQAMTISYMKIYSVILVVAMILTKLLGLAISSDRLQNTSTSLLITFIPTLIFCLILSMFLSFYEIKKTEKLHPEVMEGNFKIRFEKNFIIWQINGQNNKITYDTYTCRKGFKQAVLLSHTKYKHIVIPESLLTTDQIKTIKAHIKG